MHNSLSADEFPIALRRGLGRAFLYVQQVGIENVADIVLESCLKNQAYDRQCESSRAPWLYSMFKDSREYARFSSAIQSALETETEDCYDLIQLCELSLLMAKDGDKAAGETLRRRVFGQPFAGWDTFGCHEVVALDGLAAVVEIVRRFGRWLISNPEDDVPSLDYLTDELDILPQAKIKLEELAQTDPEIEAYLKEENAKVARLQDAPKLTKEQRQEQRRERIRSEYPLERILNDAFAGVGEYPVRYMQFGKNATEEELREVLQRLVAETDEKILLRLLWIFRRVQLPELSPRIWVLAESRNDAIREAAIIALAQSCDPKIGDLGRAKLRSPGFSVNDSEVLELFVRNYQTQDEVLIMSALARLSPNDDKAHSLGSDIRKIIEEYDSPGFLEMGRWLYETTPCTICRHSAVKWMMDKGCISPEIAAECLHDADEDTREIALQAKSI